jgi:conjugal transfer pilus assembly protein TrbC
MSVHTKPQVFMAACSLALAGSALAAPGITTGAPSTLAEDMRKGWQTYVFVSSHMPRTSLIELAREAGLAKATLVLRGFDVPRGEPIDLVRTQRFVGQINQACCSAKGAPTPHWVVDPKLFDLYQVKSAPAFALAWPGSADAATTALVQGDVALANALKFIAQESRHEALRKQASLVYRTSFGGRP